jgi:hypothetical protein
MSYQNALPVNLTLNYLFVQITGAAYKSDGSPIGLGCSWGKDSTLFHCDKPLQQDGQIIF